VNVSDVASLQMSRLLQLSVAQKNLVSDATSLAGVKALQEVRAQLQSGESFSAIA
jgi:hypothetical protein